VAYNFSQLNDKEFEVLVNDLLSANFNTHIERFKDGKDGGIDGRFFSSDGGEVIIQIKHYLKSGVSGLLASLRKEVVKVNKLKPKRYIIATSLPLNPNDKEKIKATFPTYIKNSQDVFGQGDLNDILSKNSDIEEKHFKLWITSTTVLRNILNNAIKGRSKSELESISEKSYKYVPTDNHRKALNVLDKNNIIIISGEPGIGKTTLAENVALFFASKDYEFIDIQENISEAEDVFAREKKQLFYFDDFLGSNYFEAIENKKDSHISKFIERVKKDKTKKFILTSRTNILNSGVLHSTILESRNIKKDEFLITIDELSNLEKAKILYNHIWFSQLQEGFIEVIYSRKKYHQIIKHKNFNPRLIEFITDTHRIPERASEYWSFIDNLLNNPKDVWGNAFKVQSNEFIRSVVLLTVFNGSRITEGDLRRGYDKFLSIESITNPSNTAKDFNTSIRLATKFFLNRNKRNSDVEYTLFNPSIAGYILAEYSNGTPKLISIYKSLYSVSSLRTLLDLEKNESISLEQRNDVLNVLFNAAFDGEHGYDYCLFLSHIFIGDNRTLAKISAFLKDVISTPQPIKEFSRFIELIDKTNIDFQRDFSFLLKLFQYRCLDFDELQDLFGFINKHKIEDKDS